MNRYPENGPEERVLLMRLERELGASGRAVPADDGLDPWRTTLTVTVIVLAGSTLGLIATLTVCAFVIFLG